MTLGVPRLSALAVLVILAILWPASLGSVEQIDPQAFPPAQAAANQVALPADSWRQISHGLPVSTFGDIRSVAAHPSDPNTIYAGFANFQGEYWGVYKTTDGGQNWSTASTGLPASATVKNLWVDPDNGNVLYADIDYGTYDQRLYRSLNGAGGWSHLSNAPAGLQDLDIQGSTLYAASLDGVYKSVTQGGTWSKLDTYPGNLPVHAVAARSDSPGVVFAGSYPAYLGLGPLFKSTDGGAHWSEVETIKSTDCSGWPMEIDRIHQSTMFVGSICRSVDGGQTWGVVTPLFFGASSMHVDPRDNNLVYATTPLVGGKGVLRSTDGGANWDSFNSGLPIKDPRGLGLGPPSSPGSASVAYVGIYGYGVYTTRPLALAAFSLFLPMIAR